MFEEKKCSPLWLNVSLLSRCRKTLPTTTSFFQPFTLASASHFSEAREKFHQCFTFYFTFNSWNWKSASAAISPKKSETKSFKPNNFLHFFLLSSAQSRVEHKQSSSAPLTWHNIRREIRGQALMNIFLFRRHWADGEWERKKMEI